MFVLSSGFYASADGPLSSAVSSLSLLEPYPVEVKSVPSISASFLFDDELGFPLGRVPFILMRLMLLDMAG